MSDLFKTDINNLFAMNIKNMEKAVIGSTLVDLVEPKYSEILFQKYKLPHLNQVVVTEDLKPEFARKKSYFDTNNESFNYVWTISYPQVPFLEYRPRNFIYAYGSVDIKTTSEAIKIFFSKDLSIITPPSPMDLKKMANEKLNLDLTFLNETILLINNDFESHNKSLKEKLDSTVLSRIEYLKNFGNYKY
jgi:hypothetical protein